eukprot:TRINITY_DN11325_c0_g1_i1.p1 TRINITY_DN11325_c0_g1~~TRINITY_DN11325_c0_g1_i1.p1  ORF type:complete len:294 (-),score=65.81 TRINITY_DN11325_c0_g1_i1:149-1030(-)
MGIDNLSTTQPTQDANNTKRRGLLDYRIGITGDHNRELFEEMKQRKLLVDDAWDIDSWLRMPVRDKPNRLVHLVAVPRPFSRLPMFNITKEAIQLMDGVIVVLNPASHAYSTLDRKTLDLHMQELTDAFSSQGPELTKRFFNFVGLNDLSPTEAGSPRSIGLLLINDVNNPRTLLPVDGRPTLSERLDMMRSECLEFVNQQTLLGHNVHLLEYSPQSMSIDPVLKLVQKLCEDVCDGSGVYFGSKKPIHKKREFDTLDYVARRLNNNASSRTDNTPPLFQKASRYIDRLLLKT